jgi:ABC-type polysaccharide/polyol phosphate transport system ATPase subunit
MPGPYAAVEISGLDKTFRIPRQHVMTLKERALHPFRRTEFDELRALQDVSIQILDGEFFGIVGRNGSGKSTLLKCLAGIYGADRGHIRIAGNLAPFIELGVGFNPDLAAKDNVTINGVMMGLSPAEARARFDDVIAFAELEEFLDLKLKNYSSGMQVRLAFSLMVHSDAEMLLIDEVLAVGDAAFQQKCLDVFYRLRDEGRTIILVTHDMPLIQRFCHRAMLLESGRMELIGDPREVSNRYLSLNFERGRGGAATIEPGTGVTVLDAWIEDDEGRRVAAVPYGERFHVRALIEASERIAHPDVRIALTDEDGVYVFGANSGSDGPDFIEEGQRLALRVSAENLLTNGRYFVDCSVHEGGGPLVTFRGRACDFVVFGGRPGGLVDLPHKVELEEELVEAPS